MLSKLNNNRVSNISKRYITNNHLKPFLDTLNPEVFSITEAGKSVQKKPIYKLDFGTGLFKILLWSQMHGNEATTTKAVLDFLNEVNKGAFPELLTYFSFTFIPILNPDGAETYTRVNANTVDLNRDSEQLTQPESKILRAVFESVKPHLALNMHDQRTIFSAGSINEPATISFLAPSFNESRTVNETRLIAMQLIASLNKYLQPIIPNKVGRFDDSFNINCIGDMFTYLNVPTILFEAGHYPDDYDREISRDVVYISLVKLFENLMSKNYEGFSESDYQKIPENEKNFVDVIIENFTTSDENLKKYSKLPLQMKEILNNSQISFQPVLDFNSAPNFKFGHMVLNINGLEVSPESDYQKIINNFL